MACSLRSLDTGFLGAAVGSDARAAISGVGSGSALVGSWLRRGRLRGRRGSRLGLLCRCLGGRGAAIFHGWCRSTATAGGNARPAVALPGVLGLGFGGGIPPGPIPVPCAERASRPFPGGVPFAGRRRRPWVPWRRAWIPVWAQPRPWKLGYPRRLRPDSCPDPRCRNDAVCGRRAVPGGCGRWSRPAAGRRTRRFGWERSCADPAVCRRQCRACRRNSWTLAVLRRFRRGAPVVIRRPRASARYCGRGLEWWRRGRWRHDCARNRFGFGRRLYPCVDRLAETATFRRVWARAPMPAYWRRRTTIQAN